MLTLTTIMNTLPKLTAHDPAWKLQHRNFQNTRGVVTWHTQPPCQWANSALFYFKAYHTTKNGAMVQSLWGVGILQQKYFCRKRAIYNGGIRFEFQGELFAPQFIIFNQLLWLLEGCTDSGLGQPSLPASIYNFKMQTCALVTILTPMSLSQLFV